MMADIDHAKLWNEVKPGDDYPTHDKWHSHLLEQYKINGLLVADESRTVVGAFNVHDLLRAGVM